MTDTVTRAEFEAYKAKTQTVLDAQSQLIEAIISDVQNVRHDQVKNIKSFMDFINVKFEELKNFKARLLKD